MTSLGSTTFFALPISRTVSGRFLLTTTPSRASEVSNTRQRLSGASEAVMVLRIGKTRFPSETPRADDECKDVRRGS